MKKDWFYPTSFSHWNSAEQGAIDRVVRSRQFTMAEEVKAFEHEFAALHGKGHAIMVNSGSSANLVAVAALFHKAERPLKAGDRALVPALAWSTTYAPLVQYGLDLVLADCDETWNSDLYAPRFDPQGARLFVGCSILGNPADLPGLDSAAGVLDAYFIEDNCESLGAEINGRKCGTFGLMSTFSFFHSHQISAIEGGMILTDDEECMWLCRMLRAHGWTRDLPKPPPIPFEEEYEFTLMGYNVRPLEMHAAIAREQLRKLPKFISARGINAKVFRLMTADLPIHHPTPAGTMSPFGLHFQVGSQETRSKLAAALRDKGIDCRLPTGGSFRLHHYGARWASQDTPVADHIHTCGMFIGNAPYDIAEKLEAAVDVMKEVL